MTYQKNSFLKKKKGKKTVQNSNTLLGMSNIRVLPKQKRSSSICRYIHTIQRCYCYRFTFRQFNIPPTGGKFHRNDMFIFLTVQSKLNVLVKNMFVFLHKKEGRKNRSSDESVGWLNSRSLLLSPGLRQDSIKMQSGIACGIHPFGAFP